MVPTKYKIHRLSARSVMGYAKETAQGIYSFQLTHAATEKCKASTQVEQDDNALFYQIMDELHGGSFILPADGKVVIDLSEILVYLDFAGIFDRTGIQKKYIDRQKKAECMFRPEGITLDFGSGPHRYLAFERSASMSRRAMLSFIREDFYEPIRRRIMMDLTIRQCQLSKLYAYNGLLMSSGIRVDGIGIDRPNRVIVIDNPTFKNCNVRVITVEDDGTADSMRKYHRVEKRVDELVTVCFDGEGLISKQYGCSVCSVLCAFSRTGNGTVPRHSGKQLASDAGGEPGSFPAAVSPGGLWRLFRSSDRLPLQRLPYSGGFGLRLYGCLPPVNSSL